MTIQAIAKTDVISVEKHAKLKEVAQIMREKHVGCVIITEALDGKNMPIGIVTDRDLALTIGKEENPQDLSVERIMVSKPISAYRKAKINDVIVKMKENGVRRLPIVNEDGSLYGIVSSEDVFHLLGEEMSHLAKLSEYEISKEKGMRVPVEHIS